MHLFKKIYLRFFVKSGFEYANYLKKNGFLHSQGENCFISKSANIPDPYLTSIGDNVWITSGCQLLCHDASVIMINLIRNDHLDRVAPVIIKDNCFLGNNVIVLPGTTIGSNTIVGAGSVVTKDLPENSVYAGTPARHICSLENYISKMKSDSKKYPWYDLLKQHEKHVYDPKLEEKLKVERVKYFFRDAE
ncbi:MAG: acyltransferase [Desulfobacterales bacterium]|nr:MAG: acyltransferase [Desulfobacterales bacterium]